MTEIQSKIILQKSFQAPSFLRLKVCTPYCAHMIALLHTLSMPLGLGPEVLKDLKP